MNEGDGGWVCGCMGERVVGMRREGVLVLSTWGRVVFFRGGRGE